MEKSCKQVTPEVLKEAVSKEHGVPVEEITIADVIITAGSKKGEGFVCEIAAVNFKATIQDETLDKSYIAKYAPEGPKGDFIKEMKAFDQETRTYNFLIPRLQTLRQHNSLKPLAFPKCFYASAEKELLLMENLKVQNYEVVIKKPQPLSLTAIQMVLQELAAFHATSYHFVNTYPGGKDGLNEDFKKLFNEAFFEEMKNDDVSMKSFIDFIIQMFGASSAVTKKFGSKDLAERMESYQGKILEEMGKLFMKKPRMSFITHGDAWYNNFLFRYSDENQQDLTDVIILDMQNTRIGRPGIELSYFFCSSTSPQQRSEHFQNLLKHYYDCFFEELKNLGDTSDPFFTFEELNKEYDECYTFGFVMGCAHSQVLLVNADSDAHFDLEFFVDAEESAKMIQALKVQVLSKVEDSPEYLDIILGLVEEAADRKII